MWQRVHLRRRRAGPESGPLAALPTPPCPCPPPSRAQGITEVLPSAMVLYVLRKLPPKRPAQGYQQIPAQ